MRNVMVMKDMTSPKPRNNRQLWRVREEYKTLLFTLLRLILNNISIPGINMFNNFQFEDGGIRMRLGYNVGEGKFVAYSSVQETATRQPGIHVLRY